MNPKKETITVWITRYALTRGILKVEAMPLDVDTVRWNGEIHNRARWTNEQWHGSEAHAIIYAEHMRDRKIESLKKQIAKLEKLQIKTVTP